MTAELVELESLPDEEVWFRPLNNTDFIKRDGTVHRQALKTPALRKVAGRDWSSELSGRALSKAGSISSIRQSGENVVASIRRNLEEAGKPVPSKIRFVGVAFQTVAIIRASPVAGTDAVYTPTDDMAHSDIVIRAPSDDEALEKLREYLQAALKTAPAGDLSVIAIRPTSSAHTANPKA